MSESAGHETSRKQVQKVKLFDLCYVDRNFCPELPIVANDFAQNWSKPASCTAAVQLAFFAYGRKALEDSQEGVLIAPVQH